MPSHPLTSLYPPLLSLLTTICFLIQPVFGHGYLSAPPSRVPGPALLAACGPLITTAIRRDNSSHIEGLPELSLSPSSGYDPTACNLWLCRGLQYDDNANATQLWRVGQTVKIKVKITIPHEGVANVSIVDTGKNEIVDGKMLMVWEGGYADEKEFYAGRIGGNVTSFEVVVPDLGGRCRVGGECVSSVLSGKGKGKGKKDGGRMRWEER